MFPKAPGDGALDLTLVCVCMADRWLVCVCMWITGETTSENHHADALSQYIDI